MTVVLCSQMEPTSCWSHEPWKHQKMIRDQFMWLDSVLLQSVWHICVCVFTWAAQCRDWPRCSRESKSTPCTSTDSEGRPERTKQKLARLHTAARHIPFIWQLRKDEITTLSEVKHQNRLHTWESSINDWMKFYAFRLLKRFSLIICRCFLHINKLKTEKTRL